MAEKSFLERMQERQLASAKLFAKTFMTEGSREMLRSAAEIYKIDFDTLIFLTKQDLEKKSSKVIQSYTEVMMTYFSQFSDSVSQQYVINEVTNSLAGKISEEFVFLMIQWLHACQSNNCQSDVLPVILSFNKFDGLLLHPNEEWLREWAANKKAP
jgi:hypothetical protein